MPWKDVEFQDNQPCINMLEKPPNGIFRLLDSQVRFYSTKSFILSRIPPPPTQLRAAAQNA